MKKLFLILLLNGSLFGMEWLRSWVGPLGFSHISEEDMQLVFKTCGPDEQALDFQSAYPLFDADSSEDDLYAIAHSCKKAFFSYHYPFDKKYCLCMALSGYLAGLSKNGEKFEIIRSDLQDFCEKLDNEYKYGRFVVHSLGVEFPSFCSMLRQNDLFVPKKKNSDDELGSVGCSLM